VTKFVVLLVAVAALILGAPLAAAVVLTAVASPAVGEQVRTTPCNGPLPATGAWRPPVQQAYTVTSRFGTRFHPIHRKNMLHAGVDLVTHPAPGPVVAVNAGTVATAAATTTGGNTVAVDHGGGITTRYLHLARLDVQTGDTVRTGQQVGVEGSTGASTGAHLHFEVHTGGTPIDPVPFMLARGAPLNGLAIAPSPADPAPAPVPGVPGDGEGGVGFGLPAPGQPRQASLTNPAVPVPADIKELYVEAAREYNLPWTLLAGIGMAETAHGVNTGTSTAGAQGLMQFMPATFVTMGVDGNHDGTIDIGDDADSVHSAANYLTRSGVTDGPDGVRQALFAYNHADWYVNDVLAYAAAYGGGVVLADPTDCGPGTGPGDPALPPISSERVKTVLGFAADQAGEAYVLGANGPDEWDCSSLTQQALAQVSISAPRTAQAQRDWLALGNGYRVQPGTERAGDLVFTDSYLGPDVIGHVAFVWDPATKATIAAVNPRLGVGHFSYADEQAERAIFEIWRVGSIADDPTTTP